MNDYEYTTYVIIDKLYPVVAKSLSTNLAKFNGVIADFINDNHRQLYDIAPYDNILYNQGHIDKLFNALQITENQVSDIMEDCYFWKIPLNPRAAKEPYVLVLMCAIRYFLINKKMKEAELTTVYLSFSGKFYASIFSWDAFPKAPPSKYKTCMDYVVNNMLTNKHDLKSQKNLFGAIKAQDNTWINTYSSKLTSRCTDEDIKNLVQQLRDRLRSFLMNIAKLYYQAYQNKNYLNYETDNLSDGKEFRITTNDSLRAANYTENTVNYLVSNSVSLRICNNCKDQNVKATEIKDIVEAIISDKNNINTLYRVINILICDFMRYYPDKSINSVDFVAHSIKMKPNIKDKYIIELNATILKWLDENSPNYRRRKSRTATAISYRASLIKYFAFVINYANK